MLKLKHSLINALRGIRDLLKTQQNFAVEVVVAVLVLAAAYLLHLRTIEKVAIVILIVFVLTAEGANSVLENILDGFSKNFSPKFRMAKDMLAGVVLIAVLGSIIVGFLIFWPYIRALLAPGV
ncbi:diacylglycerol kinase family protein [Patescibacteria group bacterium]|nr:diacylglycerol kinase family protein [Patescibacteria group bacterium]